jgi:hypothetical protein
MRHCLHNLVLVAFIAALASGIGEINADPVGGP